MSREIISNQSQWFFFIAAVGISWLFWVPATFIEENILESSWVILLYLGGLGPAIAGIGLTYLAKDKKNQHEYWNRVLSFKRIGRIWYLVILLAYPIIAVLIAFAVSGQVQLSETFKELLGEPPQLLLFILFIFIFGPLPEELGWRGYGLDELQKRYNAVVASIILGSIWAIWHIPLFFMIGTYQNELGFGTLAFWQFSIFAVIFSIFVTWVYNNNHRSTLSAAIFHFSVNLTGNLLEISEIEELYRNILLVILTVIIIRLFGKDKLQRSGEHKDEMLPNPASTRPG